MDQYLNFLSALCISAVPPDLLFADSRTTDALIAAAETALVRGRSWAAPELVPAPLPARWLLAGPRVCGGTACPCMIPALCWPALACPGLPLPLLQENPQLFKGAAVIRDLKTSCIGCPAVVAALAARPPLLRLLASLAPGQPPGTTPDDEFEQVRPTLWRASEMWRDSELQRATTSHFGWAATCGGLGRALGGCLAQPASPSAAFSQRPACPVPPIHFMPPVAGTGAVCGACRLAAAPRAGAAGAGGAGSTNNGAC